MSVNSATGSLFYETTDSEEIELEIFFQIGGQPVDRLGIYDDVETVELLIRDRTTDTFILEHINNGERYDMTIAPLSAGEYSLEATIEHKFFSRTSRPIILTVNEAVLPTPTLAPTPTPSPTLAPVPTSTSRTLKTPELTNQPPNERDSGPLIFAAIAIIFLIVCGCIYFFFIPKYPNEVRYTLKYSTNIAGRSKSASYTGTIGKNAVFGSLYEDNVYKELLRIIKMALPKTDMQLDEAAISQYLKSVKIIAKKNENGIVPYVKRSKRRFLKDENDEVDTALSDNPSFYATFNTINDINGKNTECKVAFTLTGNYI
jgi:hypothetical protein